MREDLARDQYSDPQAILEALRLAKDNGTRLFKERNYEEACLYWQDAALEVDKAQRSDSWPHLVRKANDAFVPELAELYFLTRLNIAHIQLSKMKDPIQLFSAGLMAEDALESAMRSLKMDFWQSGYSYTPSTPQLSKLRYRYALFLRLQAEPDTAARAIMYIEKALRLQPDDSIIFQERENIRAWQRRL